MKIGYKGTDKDMKCKHQQYELGEEYMITKDRKLVGVRTLQGSEPQKDESLNLCSDQVVHYCDTLQDCFQWYNIDNESRYFKVGILGAYKEEVGNRKSGTVHIKFLEEVSKEEIEKEKEKQRMDRLEDKLKLSKLRELQKNYPNIIVGGSISLYLQGVKLKRLERDGVHDFDLISPYWTDLKEVGAKYVDAKNSGNTFDETFEYQGILLDVVVNNNTKYNIVEFNGHKYKVNEIEEVLEYKIKYARQKNGSKHRNDIREMLCIGK